MYMCMGVYVCICMCMYGRGVCMYVCVCKSEECICMYVCLDVYIHALSCLPTIRRITARYIDR